MISLSLASVFVTNPNRRTFRSNTSPIACPAASRTDRSRSDSLFSASLTVSSSPRTGTRKAGDRLVEQARPRGAAGHLLLVQQLLQFVGKLVGAEYAQVAQPWTPVRERRLGELFLQHRIIEPVQLQREKQ